MICPFNLSGGSDGKESACMQEIWFWSLGQKGPLEKGVATHSSILAWRIPFSRGAWRATVPRVPKSLTGLSSTSLWSFMGAFQVALVVKNPPTMQLVVKNLPTMQEFNPWVEKIPWSRKWQPAPVFLPGKFHRQRSLVGYSLWGCRFLEVTLF